MNRTESSMVRLGINMSHHPSKIIGTQAFWKVLTVEIWGGLGFTWLQQPCHEVFVTHSASLANKANVHPSLQDIGVPKPLNL